jgi:hypothetical protein
MAKLNEKYSYHSWKRKTFLDADPAEFNDSEIIGAVFHQDAPYSDVFPQLPKGGTCILRECNSDNCNIPVRYSVEGGTNKHFLAQNDGEYWIVGRDLKPIAPRDVDVFIKCGLSVLPSGIPPTPLKEPITWTCDPGRIKTQKISAFAQDTARLEQILIDAGELPKPVAIPIGE